MPTSSSPTTARDLLTLLRPHGPAVEAGDLVFGAELPVDLERLLRVLHTGVRALLTGRGWWGSASDYPRVLELNPAAVIPLDIALLAVEGDARWDRVHPSARLAHPALFAARPAPGPSGAGRAVPSLRERSRL